MNINIFPNELLLFCENTLSSKATFFMVTIPNTFANNPLFLSSAEQEKFTTYSLEKRRREWLAGRLCLKRCASEYFHGSSYENDVLKTYSVENREDGRPFLSGYTEDISISHSKDFALALCAENPCGIDIQQAVPTLEKVEDRYCSKTEAKILAQLSDLPKINQLAMLWSCKEAIQKTLSGSEKMPGFLELNLTKITQQEGCHLFFLSYILQEEKRVFTVPVTRYQNYAIAYLILEESLCQNSLK